MRGYAAFRGELERAAKEQDFTAFRNLFHPRGTARLDSVRIGPGGRLDTAPRLDFWRTLDDIVERGCARNGKRLILPGLALLAEQNIAPETLITIRPTFFRGTPSLNSFRMVPLGTGRQVAEISPEARPGWTRVLLRDLDGYIYTADLRRPYGTRIEAEWYDGRWTIIEMGSGV